MDDRTVTANSHLGVTGGGDFACRNETPMLPRGRPYEGNSSSVRNDANRIVPHRTSSGTLQAGHDRSEVPIARSDSEFVGIGTQQYQRSQKLQSQQSAEAAGSTAAAPPRTKRRRRKIQSNTQPQEDRNKQYHHHHENGDPRPKKKKQTLMPSSSLSFTSESLLTSDDDDEFAFHDATATTTTASAATTTMSHPQKRKMNHSDPQFRSLPILIEERRLRGHIVCRSTIGKTKSATMMATTVKRNSSASCLLPKQFQFDALKNFTPVPSKPYFARRQWRPYVVNKNFSTSRSINRFINNNSNNRHAFSTSKIPFTQLGTPPEDAVLALHRDGNYLLSIGPYDMTATTSHGLAVRFYSLPSPHQRFMKHISLMTNERKLNRQMNQSGLQDMQQQQQQDRYHVGHDQHPSIFGLSDIHVHHTNEDAPPLQTIPLLEAIGSFRTNYGNDQVMEGESVTAAADFGVGDGFADFETEAENAIFNFQRSVSPANTPVEFLISHDWSIGICRLRPSSTSQWQDIHGVTSRRGDHNINGISNNQSVHLDHDDQQQRHREDGDDDRDENDPYQPELAPVGSLVLFTLPHGRTSMQNPRTGSLTDDCGTIDHKKQKSEDGKEEEESMTDNIESAAPAQEKPSNTNQIYYRCRNVQIVSNAGMTTRNLLWNVDFIPTQVSHSVSYHTTSSPFSTYVEAPGYLFLNDEADGFRLTWITTSNRSYLAKANCHSTKDEEAGLASNIDANKSETEGSKHIITIESSWEENCATLMLGQPIHRSTYCPSSTHDTPTSCASIVSEAYLHIDRVLAQVLQGRKGMISPPGQRRRPVLPEFCYNLISLKNNGRTAQLLVAFLRPKGGYALGIFVDVDLFSGTYTEKNWVQDRQVRDAAAMHFWCTKLALNCRMKEVRAGPYALSANEHNYKDWTRLCREVGNFNPDYDDDFDLNFWDALISSFCEPSRTGSSQHQAAKRGISLASLYPCCDVVTNEALIDCRPVMSIRANNSPIRLLYG